MTVRLLAALMAAAALALLAGGCGSPNSPGTLALSGSWSGTWQFSTSGTVVTDTVTSTVSQSSTTATGNWTSTSGATGTFSFAVAANYSGTFTIKQTTISGFQCSASTTMSGTATSNAIDFTVGTLTPNGQCQWATGNQFALKR